MKLIEQTIGAYSDLLASDFPTPGGGSTAALNGVLGCSFITMIARITLKKPGFAGSAALLRRISGESESLRQGLLALVDEDTEAYNGIMAARAAPQSTEVLRGALKTAVETPLRILKSACAALDLARLLSGNYYTGTASDLALAACNLETAARGACLTIRINLNHIGAMHTADTKHVLHHTGEAYTADAEYIQLKTRESAGLLAEAEDTARSIYDGAKTLLHRGPVGP
jgi:formiminotetrahydrofolate cyclodeaminase